MFLEVGSRISGRRTAMAQRSCGGFAAGVDPLAGYSVEYLKEYIRDREVQLVTGAVYL